MLCRGGPRWLTWCPTRSSRRCPTPSPIRGPNPGPTQPGAVLPGPTGPRTAAAWPNGACGAWCGWEWSAVASSSGDRGRHCRSAEWPPPCWCWAASSGWPPCGSRRSPRSLRLQLSALGMVVASTLANQGIGIHTRRFYSTDSAAFNQVGAKLLLHGIDPYAATLGSAAKLLKAPAQFWTYTVAGGHVDHVSYPAGSILLQVPALALGFHHEVVDWLDLLAWVVTGVLIFALLPASVRWLATLLLLAPAFSGVFGSGGTDAAFLPFLVLAVWRWDRYGLGRSAGVARWMGPVALGLACSIKQTPWFCIPFLAIGLAVEARMSGRAAVARGRPLPGHRGGRLRRREPPVHHLAALGVGTRDVPALRQPAHRRRAGPGHPRPPRDRPRGVAPPPDRVRPPGAGGTDGRAGRSGTRR